MSLAPEDLQFPRGVRFATREEIPKCTDELLARIESAHLTTGFVSNSSEEGEFSTYIEANVHADMVWGVVEALVIALLPQIAAPIVGWKDEEPTLGPYTDKEMALAVFRHHVENLQHDGFIEFGLIFQHEGLIEEVFVKSVKHLQIWTNKGKDAEALLQSMGIPKMSRLAYIDEFPRVTIALDACPSTQEVISSIVESFRFLPTR